MNKFFKLNVGFKPWWCEHFLDVYPSYHIETILSEEYWGYYEDDVYLQYGYWWKEIKNVQYTQDYVYLEETEPNIPLYIKYTTDEMIYYYYLYSKDKLTTVNKQGKSLYSCVYFIDKYMTVYFDKLQILLKKNPMVKFNRKYCVPWIKIDDTHYEINFVKKKELSSYLNDINYELVRNEIFSVTEKELYDSLGVSGVPENLNWLKKASNTGRYRYVVLKSSSLSNVNNNKITPINVKQTIIIVPIKDDNTLNQISNVDLSSTIQNKIVLSESNFIGIFECDLPYSYLYGLHLKDSENIKFLQDSSNVYYFELPLNYFNKNILINYLKYNKGFYGKLDYIFRNSYKVIPETEIVLLAPQYYREVYNNGSGLISNDLSKFIFKWSTNEPLIFNLYVTLQFNSDLGIAYNYGENTNTQLASYDNTNTQISNVSIPIGLVGSAATQYFANNINTSLTSIQNRKLDQEQAHQNIDFDSTRMIQNTYYQGFLGGLGNVFSGFAKGGIIGGFGALFNSAANIAERITNNINNIAQMNFNYQQNQIRANRELTAKINNIYSSPNINLSNPFLKGVIPNNKDTDNNFQLFKHYAYELHPYDKKLIFAKLLDEGYIYNCVDNLNNFIARKYMNILNIDPYMHYSHLLSILKENDKTLFNSPKDYDDFFIWLAKPKKIYNTNKLINVLDWQENDYIHNIYLKDMPLPMFIPKININTYTWNIPKWLPNYDYDYDFWVQECLNTIQESNPDIPENLWNFIDFVPNKNSESIIRVKENSTYEGEIIVDINFWVVHQAFKDYKDGGKIKHIYADDYYTFKKWPPDALVSVERIQITKIYFADDYYILPFKFDIEKTTTSVELLHFDKFHKALNSPNKLKLKLNPEFKGYIEDQSSYFSTMFIRDDSIKKVEPVSIYAPPIDWKIFWDDTSVAIDANTPYITIEW